MRTITMIAAATVVAATQAQAGTAAVGQDIHGRFTLAEPAQTWTLPLVAGKGYALTGSSGWCSTYVVRRPGGTVVARTSADADPASEDLHAAEFVAPVTGTYSLRASGTPCWTGLRSAYYDTGVFTDCPGSVRSRCRLAVGRTWTGAHLTGDDADWIGVPLLVGQSYTFTGTTYGRLVLRDPDGTVVASAEPGPDEAPATVHSFAPQRGGVWFLSDEDDGPTSFTLTVSQP